MKQFFVDQIVDFTDDGKQLLVFVVYQFDTGLVLVCKGKRIFGRLRFLTHFADHDITA